jgi:acyl carrier protein
MLREQPERTPMTESEVREKVRAYIRDAYLYMRPGYQLDDAESLLESGIIDSLAVLELLEFVDAQFAIKVADDEITEQNFGSVDAIVRLITGKARVAAA